MYFVNRAKRFINNANKKIENVLFLILKLFWLNLTRHSWFSIIDLNSWFFCYTNMSTKTNSSNSSSSLSHSIDSNQSYVGFANLPNQVHRKFVKKGFEFTLMVLGELNFFMYWKGASILRLLWILRGVWIGQVNVDQQSVSYRFVSRTHCGKRNR